MKTLYITDLDGTFLNSQARISDKSAEIINYLTKEKGLLFSVATARTYATVLDLFTDVKLSAPSVLMNGVMIYDTTKNEIAKFHSLSDDIGKTIIDIYSEYDIFPLTYLLSKTGKIDIYHQALRNDPIKNYVKQRTHNGIKRFHKIDTLPPFGSGELVYLTGMDRGDVLTEICRRVSLLDGVGHTFCKDNYSDCFFLETFSDKATKAAGARDVKELVGADRIVAFGDNLNDIPLFEAADECYAVKNAAKELKEMATGVIDSNDDDAVARFILERF